MPFLLPNQQRQNTEGICTPAYVKGIMSTLQKIAIGNQHYLMSGIGMLALDAAEKSAGPAVHHPHTGAYL